MTSRLGVYWSVAHRRPQDYAFFDRLNPSVMKVMDGGDVDYKWIREYLPDSLVVARIHSLSEQHTDMLKDPVGTGKRHAQEWNRHQQRLGFDKAKTLILGINEPHIWEPGVSEALRLYTIALCDEATVYGLRVGAMQLSVGWPNNDGPDTPPNWSAWHGVDNAIRHNNGVLIGHEYWADNGPGENWGWWGGRILKCPWQVPIVIGECGVDMYVKDGSVQRHQRGWLGRMTPERYAQELADYTARMSADSRFIGNCVFAADFASQDWFSFDIETAYQAILATPVPDVKPDTPPVVIHLPQIESGKAAPVTDFDKYLPIVTIVDANIRKQPSLDSEVIKVIPKGTRLNAVGETGNWYAAIGGGADAFMVSQVFYIHKTVAKPIEQPTTPTPPEPPSKPVEVTTGIIDPRVLEAILQVESGGRAYGPDGKKLLIRFEAHVFRYRLKYNELFDQHFRHSQNQEWQGQEFRFGQSAPWRAIHTGSQDDEHAALSLAASLNPVAAFESISMGAPQIMGFNCVRIGYPTAITMFESFQRSINAQIIGMINYMLSDPALVRAINTRDFEGIARGYNGGGNVAEAAAKYRAAYERLA